MFMCGCKLPTFVCNVIIKDVNYVSVFKLENQSGEYFVSLTSDRLSRVFSFRLLEVLVNSSDSLANIVELDKEVSIVSSKLRDLYIFFNEIVSKKCL